MKYSKAVKPLQKIYQWHGTLQQNLPYYVSKTRIFKLRGCRHERHILNSLTDTMARHRHHLFLFSSERVEDLDIRLPNVVPMLHVSSRKEFETKIDDYLALELPIVAISAFATEMILPTIDVEWVILGGHKFQPYKQTIQKMSEVGVPVYTEVFQSKTTAVPAELCRYEYPSTLTFMLHKCEENNPWRLSRNESSCI